MNLKESFTYQIYLDRLFYAAREAVNGTDVSLIITKTHKKSAVNPDAADEVEVSENEKPYNGDDVLEFLLWLIQEKNKLTSAITEAKIKAEFDMASAIETNKYRRGIAETIYNMNRNATKKKTTSKQSAYKFNVEGNQTAYYYELDTEFSPNYNINDAKKLMVRLKSEADDISNKIDSVKINTEVDYTPRFNINEDFEDVIAAFVEERKEKK